MKQASNQFRPSNFRPSNFRPSNFGPGQFHPRQLAIMIAIGVVAFVCSIYLMLFGDSTNSAGSNTYSHSAVGHGAFLEILQRLDIPVSVSRFKSLDKAGPTTLLVLAEPEDDVIGQRLLDQLSGEAHVLVVLPKWQAEPHRQRPDWVGEVSVREADSILPVLQRIVPGADLVRPGTFAAAQQNQLGYTPALSQPQLVRSDKLSPIISNADGILLGEMQIGKAKLWLLSDPDVIVNAGIGKGGNAGLAVALVRAHLPAGGAVLIDETIHGFERAPNLLRTAFELPFVTATIAFALAVGTAVLAGITRLGPAVPNAPALAAGRGTLLRNVADLLEFGRGGSAVLDRYPRLILADVAARLKVPASLDEAGQIAWLDQRAKRLGLPHLVGDLLAESATLAGRPDINRSAAAIGRRVHQWKREMLHESRNRAVD